MFNKNLFLSLLGKKIKTEEVLHVQNENEKAPRCSEFLEDMIEEVFTSDHLDKINSDRKTILFVHKKAKGMCRVKDNNFILYINFSNDGELLKTIITYSKGGKFTISINNPSDINTHSHLLTGELTSLVFAKLNSCANILGDEKATAGYKEMLANKKSPTGVADFLPFCRSFECDNELVDKSLVDDFI